MSTPETRAEWARTPGSGETVKQFPAKDVPRVIPAAKSDAANARAFLAASAIAPRRGNYCF